MAKTATNVKYYREVKGFKRAGEIEGMSVDPSSDDLQVLSNRSYFSRVFGMIKEFYRSCKEKLHELYVYKIIK